MCTVTQSLYRRGHDYSLICTYAQTRSHTHSHIYLYTHIFILTHVYILTLNAHTQLHMHNYTVTLLYTHTKHKSHICTQVDTFITHSYPHMGVCIHMHEGYIASHKTHIHTHAPLHVHTPLKLKLQSLSLKGVQKKSS